MSYFVRASCLAVLVFLSSGAFALDDEFVGRQGKAAKNVGSLDKYEPADPGLVRHQFGGGSFTGNKLSEVVASADVNGEGIVNPNAAFALTQIKAKKFAEVFVVGNNPPLEAVCKVKTGKPKFLLSPMATDPNTTTLPLVPGQPHNYYLCDTPKCVGVDGNKLAAFNVTANGKTLTAAKAASLCSPAVVNGFGSFDQDGHFLQWKSKVDAPSLAENVGGNGPLGSGGLTVSVEKSLWSSVAKLPLVQPGSCDELPNRLQEYEAEMHVLVSNDPVGCSTIDANHVLRGSARLKCTSATDSGFGACEYQCELVELNLVEPSGTQVTVQNPSNSGDPDSSVCGFVPDCSKGGVTPFFPEQETTYPALWQLQLAPRFFNLGTAGTQYENLTLRWNTELVQTAPQPLLFPSRVEPLLPTSCLTLSDTNSIGPSVGLAGLRLELRSLQLNPITVAGRVKCSNSLPPACDGGTGDPATSCVDVIVSSHCRGDSTVEGLLCDTDADCGVGYCTSSTCRIVDDPTPCGGIAGAPQCQGACPVDKPICRAVDGACNCTSR